MCANAFAYADDIVLLSPSCTALQNLIQICEIYATEFEIKFNPDKCTLLIFSKSNDIENLINVMLCGCRINNVFSEKHLGHTFSTTYEQTFNLINLEGIIRDMKVRTNTIIAQFKPISWKSKVTLFNSQCLSLYGCQLWRLDDPKVKELCTTWKVCSRRLLNLSQRTRSRLIHHLMNTAPIQDIIMYRMLNFFTSGLNHKDTVISNFYKNTLTSNTSYMLVNINMILKHFGIRYHEIFTLNKYKLKQIVDSKIDEKDWQTSMIEELISMREDNITAGLNQWEIRLMLEQLCTDFSGS